MNQGRKIASILKNLLKVHQLKIVLVLGYLLVAGLAFSIGHFSAPQPDNYIANTADLQSETASAKPDSCLIKGTATSRIYHMKGQSNYENLKLPVCFGSEADAQAAGFRKAMR